MDIKNYQIQCIKCLDHDNLVTYLNNHEYTLEASILHRTGIDGMEFLEITERELHQYKLNHQQAEIILCCRDFILGKKNRRESKMNRNSSTKNLFLDVKKKASEPEENIYMDMNKIVPPVVPPKPKVEVHRQSRTKPKLVKSSGFCLAEPSDSKLNFSQMQVLHSDKSIDKAIGVLNNMVSVEGTDYISSENIIKQQSTDCYQNLKVVMAEMEAFNNKRTIEAYQTSADSKVDEWQNNICEVQSSYSASVVDDGFSQKPKSHELVKILNQESGKNEDFATQQEELLWNNRKWLPPPAFSDDSVDVPIITVSDSGGPFPRPPPLTEIDPEHIKLVKDLLNDFKVSQKNVPYYRNTNREGAKELLQQIPNLRDGLFLFRNSKEYFLAITIYHQGGFCHSGVHRNGNGNYYCEIYGDQGRSTLFEFETLRHFVQHFKKNPFVVKLNDVKRNIYLREMDFEDFILTL